MPDINISVEGVEKLLTDLDPGKATGPDDVPARILKMGAAEIEPALTTIFRRSHELGSLPSDWRCANISPVFKKGDRTKPSIYRPVSLTSICCKVMEHVIHSNVMHHLDHHDILTDKQHGFRRNRSCESQLILTTHDFVETLDQRGQTDVVIMNVSKAFDVVPHNRLNLTSNVRLFADDCVICRAISGDNDAYLLQTDLDRLTAWESTWQMKFNPDKCFVLKITHSNQPRTHTYSLNHSIPQETDSHTYLGVEIASNLKWNKHVNNISAKGNRSLGFIKRNLKGCTEDIKNLVYRSLVRPQLEYCAAGMGPIYFRSHQPNRSCAETGCPICEK